MKETNNYYIWNGCIHMIDSLEKAKLRERNRSVVARGGGNISMWNFLG